MVWREGPCESSLPDPDLTDTPFLAVAVVNLEMLRAQEEWEVVDTIHPDTGKSSTATIRIHMQSAVTGHFSYVTQNKVPSTGPEMIAYDRKKGRNATAQGCHCCSPSIQC